MNPRDVSMLLYLAGSICFFAGTLVAWKWQ